MNYLYSGIWSRNRVTWLSTSTASPEAKTAYHESEVAETDIIVSGIFAFVENYKIQDSGRVTRISARFSTPFAGICNDDRVRYSGKEYKIVRKTALEGQQTGVTSYLLVQA